ncbi:MAG: hypothetical protein AAFY76_17415, partial [Cyanobacteria bacterium J06649_11]
MSEQVVKAKNEGRVAANRKNKEDLLKNKNQVNSSGESSTNEVSLSTSPSTYSSSSVYGIGAAVALAGIAVFFLWKRNTPNPTPQPVAKPENDIFRMN